jgi:hypothetical protein
MTITGGQVVVHEIHNVGWILTYQGSVNAAGEVSAWHENKGAVQFRFLTVSGTIQNKVFTGHRLDTGNWCDYDFQMRQAAAAGPTMSFDGWYSGVPREVLDGESNRHTCDPRALPPPVGLRVSNGVVGIPGITSWEGTVSPQGAVVMRNRAFTRVDGQIDPQGTIRGQCSGELPSRLGGGTNCIVKFVWQKE